MKSFFWPALTVWQWIWGLPQNLAGAVIAAVTWKQAVRRERFRTALVLRYGKRSWLAAKGAFSLGMFLFIPEAKWVDERVVVHEYGHTVQSLILGPLFLPVVGIPSILWAWYFGSHRDLCRRRGITYGSRFPESSANRLGTRVTGRRSLE